MFQRLKGELKGALDTIADEQNRLRQQQASYNAERRSDSQTRQRQSRLRTPASDLTVPDPDPNQFVVGDDTPVPTPDPPNPDGPILEREAKDDVTDHHKDLPQARDSRKSYESSNTPNGSVADTQAKLRRLNKLEIKYQELLKAYRRAHARNSLIEPFEASLRECTPLTSINDPITFTEYITQLNAKGDMVMNEFKKVSEDRDALREKLASAEHQVKVAHDEVAQFRDGQSDLSHNTKSSFDTAVATDAPDKDTSSDRISKLSEKSSRLEPAADQNEWLTERETKEDMFSIEDEVPKLQMELEARYSRIQELEATQEMLQRDLASAQESTEQLMRDLEKAQLDLESKDSSMLEKDRIRQEEISTLNQRASLLATQLSGARTETEAAREQVTELTKLHHVDGSKINDLEKHVQVLESQSFWRAVVHNQSSADQQVSEGTNTIVGGESSVQADEVATQKIDVMTRVEAASGVENMNRCPNEKPEDMVSIRDIREEERESLNPKLNAALRHEEDLKDEIENLRDELLLIGEEYVQAREKIKILDAEKAELLESRAALEARIDDLESTLGSRMNDADQLTVDSIGVRVKLLTRVKLPNPGIEDHEPKNPVGLKESSYPQQRLMDDFEELKSRSKVLETDLSAAQSLAASRFKEITTLREHFQKAQPELASLRTQLSELKASHDDVLAKNKELRRLGLKEESLRSEIEVLKKGTTSKESEIRSLNQKISHETTLRIAAEETNRRTQRDLQRTTSEKDNAVSSRDAASADLRKTRSQFEESQNRVQQLEDQLEHLSIELDALRDEIGLKSAQHASAESLMSSVRDQADELKMQMKEAQERCESLEEELQDAHRLMGERGKEGEAMRRLLSEVDGRADAKVKEMRDRMEMALQDRDIAEEELASVGRRRTREVEEYKGQLREAERSLRRIRDEKDDLERAESELKRQKEASDRRTEQSMKELEDVNKAMTELRDGLDDSERQMRFLEDERGDLKRLLDEAQSKMEKLHKSNRTLTEDLRNLRATRIRTTDSPSQSSRSSLESTRRIASPSPAPSSTNLSRGLQSATSSQAIDYVHLKNVLLKFIEQRDKSHQLQLVPVLSMLLKFDKKDEQKWTTAISSR